MKHVLVARGALAGMLALSLSACGGGGAGGDVEPPRSTTEALIGEVSMSDLENSVGVSDGTRKETDSAAVLNYKTPSGAGATIRGTNMAVTFRNGREEAPLTMEIDRDGSGTYETAPGDDDLSRAFDFDAGDEPTNRMNQTGTIRTGGRTIQVARQIGLQNDRINPDYDRQGAVYIPADDAQNMYGGLVVMSDPSTAANGPGGSAIFGVFGDNTSDADVPGAARGSVSYDGIGSVYVDRTSESGIFEGFVSGVVDFSGRTVSTTGTLTRDENGEDITVSTAGSFTTAGGNAGVVGTSTTSFADGTRVSGSMEGSFYGPNGETLGQTFMGSNSTTGVNVVGGQILNAN